MENEHTVTSVSKQHGNIFTTDFGGMFVSLCLSSFKLILFKPTEKSEETEGSGFLF